MKSGLIALILLFCALAPCASYAKEHRKTGGLDVVVHRDIQQDSISRNVLRAIFGMRLHKWPDGTQVKVFVLKDDATFHVAFSKEILHVFPHQLRRAWDRLIYSGTGQSPFQVRSIVEMMEKIRNVPGAIGYLPEGKDQDVNVLKVR